jgi:hypothetical protein
VDGDLYEMQRAMHDLRVDDRVISIMEELVNQVPKKGKHTKEDLLSTLLGNNFRKEDPDK